MTKVCHMTSAHTSEDERIFFKECVSLAQAGFETFLVAQGESYEKNGIRIVGVGQPSGGRLSRMIFFSKKIYQIALSLNADIYHFHDPELLPYGLKLKKKGKKIVFDSHENTAEQILEKGWIPKLIRLPLYYIFNRYQNWVCHQLDAVISVTPHICEKFKHVNSHTVMIANYPTLRSLPAQTRIQSKSICFAGGISPQWRHKEIICAIAQIPNCIYRLCGDGQGEYFQSFSTLPGWKNVDFIGRIPHEEIHALLASCSVGMSILAYSRNTGGKMGTMGNTKIFEEMMAGLPVICTNFDLWREFVERYNCGICVNPDSVEEITAAVSYMLDHPEEARKMGQNGLRAVTEEFNWGIEEKKLLTLYGKILAEVK